MSSPPTATPGNNTARPQGLANAIAFREIVIAKSGDSGDVATSITFSSGTTVPTHTRPDGSEYWNTTTGDKYVRRSGVWALDSGGTAPTLSAAAEAADVIAITVTCPVASVERYEAIALDDTTMQVNTAAFTCAETGVGAEVSPTARGRLIFTTDASGAAEISVTDVAGASGKTVWVEVRPLFDQADLAQACAPGSLSITFD